MVEYFDYELVNPTLIIFSNFFYNLFCKIIETNWLLMRTIVSFFIHIPCSILEHKKKTIAKFGSTKEHCQLKYLETTAQSYSNCDLKISKNVSDIYVCVSISNLKYIL